MSLRVSLLIPLLLGTGLYLTIRLGGIQLVRLIPALRLGLIKRSDGDADGDISQFQALTTAMAATVGAKASSSTVVMSSCRWRWRISRSRAARPSW